MRTSVSRYKLHHRKSVPGYKGRLKLTIVNDITHHHSIDRLHHHNLQSNFTTTNMSTQKAVVHVSENVAECKSDVPIPKLSADNWILVKTKAVALNPTDWKNIAKATQPGAIAGCDYAGVVEEVGKSVTNYKVGDRICGFVRGGEYFWIVLRDIV
jgi:hypothetical protein